MKVEVDGTSWAPVPNKPTVSVDVKQHFNCVGFRAQELSESRGDVLGSHPLDVTYGFSDSRSSTSVTV